MKRRLEFLVILCAAVMICSVASHIAVGWLGINSTWGGYKRYGAKNGKPLAVLHGSSLAYSGLDWGRISEGLSGPIESWATAGSSPTEWEVLHSRSPEVRSAFIVVSAYDLNEYWLCDFRADIVPLGRTIGDLRKSDLDWQQWKRILSQYPRMLVRKLFPSVGRSDGILVGFRAKLQKLMGRSADRDAGEAPKLVDTGKSEIKERISDWSEARLQRRLVLLRGTCQGKQSFDGPKKAALVRLLQQAEKQGPAMLVVMPVPPIYHREFLGPAVIREFEDTLADVQRLCPAAKLVRLDRVAALDNNELFYDPVHLNMYGQQIATESFMGQLKSLAVSRPVEAGRP
jgi:hypothetical protein